MNDAQRAAIHEALRDRVGVEKASKVARQMEDRYRLPQPIHVYINLILREEWRLENGDTRAWDSTARAAGFDPSLYERMVPV